MSAEMTIQHTPVFFAYGLYDSVVPSALVQSSRGRLQELGCDVTSMDYPIAHTIDVQEIADLSAWLESRLKA